MRKLAIKISIIGILLISILLNFNIVQAAQLKQTESGKNYIIGVSENSTAEQVIGSFFSYKYFREQSGLNEKELNKALDSATMSKQIKEKDGTTYKNLSQLVTTGTTYTNFKGEVYTIVLKGDFNCDGVVDLLDLFVMKRYMLGLEIRTDKTDKYATLAEEILGNKEILKSIMDFNGDGNVKSSDLLALKKYLISKVDVENVSGDLNYDGVVNANDYQIMLDVRNNLYTLTSDQETKAQYYTKIVNEELESRIRAEFQNK